MGSVQYGYLRWGPILQLYQGKRFTDRIVRRKNRQTTLLKNRRKLASLGGRFTGKKSDQRSQTRIL